MNVVLGILFIFLRLLQSEVGLRVLVHRPVAGVEGAIAELAGGLQRSLDLHPLIWVGRHAGWEIVYLSAAHGWLLLEMSSSALLGTSKHPVFLECMWGEKQRVNLGSARGRPLQGEKTGHVLLPVALLFAFTQDLYARPERKGSWSEVWGNSKQAGGE